MYYELFFVVADHCAGYDLNLQRWSTGYSEMELRFIRANLMDLAPSALAAYRKEDFSCYYSLLNYIGAIIYAWYISYDFDCIPWIRKMLCTEASFDSVSSKGRTSCNQSQVGFYAYAFLSC